MLRVASGTTDQYLYFDAGEIGLSSFTVYRSRNGAAAAAMTTPTINETDSTNMPGIYELLMNEDMTIGSGNVTEHMIFFITHSGIESVKEKIELFSPANYSLGTPDVNVAQFAGVAVQGAGTSGDLWRAA